MPSWDEILEEINSAGTPHDTVRRKYLRNLHELTGRNIIVYYSGWLQKGLLPLEFHVSDGDKNGFMSTIHQLDRDVGLDLVLHTPGGDVAATESLVEYLRLMFNNDIRAIIPQVAMSAGTMIACSCKEIVMGKHSSLGPIDPQIQGLPAHGIIEEFNRARNEIIAIPETAYVWQHILSRYHPTLIGECEKAIQWGNEMVKEWLMTGMFSGEPDAETNADRIISELADHSLTKSHARHISMTRAMQLGLKITPLEDDQEFQDAVLSVHHACIETLAATQTVKFIENHLGVAYMQTFGPS